ncbi:hypothetical protein [Paraglaciecola sp. 25GB23A]|uniref:hypothetical protein n=1 Tax=Paraglaciecola sp. 25GB23A TaxID=3156068 RepID=UPI0032AFC5FD
MLKIYLALILLIITGCATSNKSNVANFKAIADSNLVQITDSSFDRFVISDPAVFSKYKQVIFFPMQFDRLTIDNSAEQELVDSWSDSNWQEMDQICQYFDDFALKIFSERQGLTPTNQGGENVLAIEFRLINFMPYGKRYQDSSMDTVGVSANKKGTGSITIQVVIADSKTAELLAIIEDGMEVNTGNMTIITGDLSLQTQSNNKSSQNYAWRRVFKQWATRLHDDLVRLQNLPHETIN